MFQSNDLLSYLQKSPTVKTRSLVIAEWNLNVSENIRTLGNYRYRPASTSKEDAAYVSLTNIFVEENESTLNPKYYGATDFDVLVNGGIDESKIPIALTSQDVRRSQMFSLEDCVARMRPRSGINKAVWFDDTPQFFPTSDANMHERPRYYVASRDDKFKYWTSYRQESVSTKDSQGNNVVNIIPRGRSTKEKTKGGKFYIDDAVPFVVYRDNIPANKIVIKMQTNTGIGSGSAMKNITDINKKNVPDPFFADPDNNNRANMTIPKSWIVQGLYASTSGNVEQLEWRNLKSNDILGTDLTLDNTIIKNDGYVELVYGLLVPTKFKSNFQKVGTYTSTDSLPEKSILGYAYLVKENSTDRGTFYIWNGGINNDKMDNYDAYVPQYSWRVGNQDVSAENQYVTDLTNPDSFTENGIQTYREFQNIRGIRIVVTEMNKQFANFDLIEMSPRLSVDLSSKTTSFEINKVASDIGNSGLPVGQLLVSNGSLSIFDYDQAFNSDNTSSIINKFMSKNLQIKMFDVVEGVPNSLTELTSDYYVPLKTMYADGFQDSTTSDRTLSINLRDMYFYFESMKAPQLLFSDISLSRAICFLMDSIGFSNYTILRDPKVPDPIIPFFFIEPEVSVAEVLNNLATSTQSAMFFDEYNNFVIMTKEYMLPKQNNPIRTASVTLTGNKSGDILPNIVDVADKKSEIYNDGKIVYASRHIQRSVTSLKQATQLEDSRSYGYQPVLLWEVSPTENTKSQNELTAQQSSYALTAIPLDQDLTANLPRVENGKIVNNIIKMGAAAYWMTRYNGYFYANGEIIKFDAVEYQVEARPVYVESTIVAGSINISVPSVADFKIGQVLKKYGDNPGEFYGNNPVTIEAIDVENKILKVSRVHKTSGVINFFTVPSNTYWIESTEEYQNYFSKLPFGGKMYPTGNVRIFAKAKANSDGTLVEGDIPAERHGRGQFGTQIVSHPAGIGATSSWMDGNHLGAVYMNSDYLFKGGTIPSTNIGKSGTGLGQDYMPDVRSFISNFLSSSPTQEDSKGKLALDTSAAKGTVQSSALTVRGPFFESDKAPLNYVSYVYKPLYAKNADGVTYTPIPADAEKITGFGCRVRIVGAPAAQGQTQSPDGSSVYATKTIKVFDPEGGETDKTVNVGGASGGMSILLDPTTNTGYYFEIVALTDTSFYTSSSKDSIANVLFYKIKRNTASNTTDTSQAIPDLLWSGLAPINVDNGKLTGQSRMSAEENPSVYDLAIEYSKSATGITKTFDLYINGKVIASVTDNSALPDMEDMVNKTYFSLQNGDTYSQVGFDSGVSVYSPNSIALFSRGSSNIMFENAYVIGKNKNYNAGSYTSNKNQEKQLNDTTDKDTSLRRTLFTSSGNSSNISKSAQFSRYSIPGPIVKTHIENISPSSGSPEYAIWYEEFGTIMREMAYFNVKYDKAYPAIYSKISPTFNDLCGYTVSGYTPNAYGAEFLVFNNTDFVINLDSTSGNYLRIQGIAFTQQSQHDLTVDEFFKTREVFTSEPYSGTSTINPVAEESNYLNIKNSRTTYGNKAFSLEPKYVQSQDAANSLMDWVINLVSKPRRSVGIRVFNNPMIQLGDIVSLINIPSENGYVSWGKFVVYHMTYTRNADGPDMVLYLSEVNL